MADRKQERDSKFMRYFPPYAGLGAVVAVILLTGAASPSPSVSLTPAPSSASPVQSPPESSSPSQASSAGPLFTCGANQFYMDNSAPNTGDAYFNNSEDRLTMAGNFTEFCTNHQSGINIEFDLIGENNCLTYAGPKTGKSPLGYIDKTTCAGKSSQTWTWYSNGWIKNAYTGWCLDGPTFDGKPFLEACNASDQGQQWLPQGI